MFSKLKHFMTGGRAEPSVDSHALRLSTYITELDEPEHTFPDDSSDRIDIHAFGRDFEPREDRSDEGYVLVTNGMSDRRMMLPASGLNGDEKSRAELMWYVRTPTPEIVGHLRWLARLPAIDSTWFGFGHRVPMPTPPLQDCAFKTFLFLTPIIGPDKRIAETLSADGEPVDILTVNLVSDAEYRLIKQEGLGSFLDLLDDRDYPPIFDPARPSYV